MSDPKNKTIALNVRLKPSESSAIRARRTIRTSVWLKELPISILGSSGLRDAQLSKPKG